jgi:hypothetical protein
VFEDVKRDAAEAAAQLVPRSAAGGLRPLRVHRVPIRVWWPVAPGVPDA